MKGLYVEFYRPAYTTDCTNGGVSSRFKEAILVGPDVTGPCDTETDRSAKELPILVYRNYTAPGMHKIQMIHAVPIDLLNAGKWTMFGGNFIYTSDSRFPQRFPIPVHDRVED